MTDQMKQQQAIDDFVSVSRMTIVAMIGFGISISVGVINAQTADVFDVKKARTTDEFIAGEGKDAPAPVPVDSQPSRFAGQEIEPYVAARAAVFSMRNRAVDPFGLFQDPNAKPTIRRVVTGLPSKRQTALPPTPLSDIIKLIRVTTIMPGERKFLVGVRSFSEGEEFSLIFQEKTIKMKVLEVTARRILFRNLDKGEEASLETEMLPPGMMVGAEGLRPPGMVSPTENMPLNLGSSPNDPNN
jgi:hypothetical protein